MLDLLNPFLVKGFSALSPPYMHTDGHDDAAEILQVWCRVNKRCKKGSGSCFVPGAEFYHLNLLQHFWLAWGLSRHQHVLRIHQKGSTLAMR